MDNSLEPPERKLLRIKGCADGSICMGNQVSSRTRHVYNNTGRDVQVYAVPGKALTSSVSTESFPLSDNCFNCDPRELIGTIPSNSSKTLVLPHHSRYYVAVLSGVCGCIRRVPDSKSFVVENDPSSVVGIRVCAFSPLSHVELPSHLMNIDVLVSPVISPKDPAKVLNRTVSTAVSSPKSSPSQIFKLASPAKAARAACLVSSHVLSWKFSNVSVPVFRVDPSIRRRLRPLEVFKRNRTGECLIVVGGLAVSIGHLETDWDDSAPWVDVLPDCGDDEVTQREVYSKLVIASSLTLRNPSSSIGILGAVGKDQTDMSLVLAGAVLLDNEC